MNLFCLLWAPLFYFFWVSLFQAKGSSPGGVWALLLGSVFALIKLITGPWIAPGEFGDYRWFSALVDTVGIPALLPLVLYALFAAFRIIPFSGDPAGFALLWLIPQGIFRSVSQEGRHDPLFLVLVPLLWTAIVVGISLFIRAMLGGNRRFLAFLAVPGILALPLAAITCYWAFFCQWLLWGWALFAISLLPLVISTGFSIHRAWKYD
jgi:hypothetical protein